MKLNFKLFMIGCFFILVFLGKYSEAGMTESKSRVFHPEENVWHMFDRNDALKSQDWWGLRGRLEEKGISFEVLLTNDFDFNTRGGLHTGYAYLNNLDYSMTVDTEKLGLWRHGTFFIAGASSYHTKHFTDNFVGDLQGADNIDAPRLTRLYELWYQHNMFEDKVSMLLGFRDVNAEFYTSEYGGLFINGSFGIGPDVTANTTSSVYPITTLGYRLKISPCEHFDLLAGVWNGDPGDEDLNPKGTRVSFNKKHGIFTIVEGDFHSDIPMIQGETLPGALKFGLWHNSKDIADIADTTMMHDDNMGIYAVLDQMVYREKDNQGLGVFVQYGNARDDRNTIDNYIGGGINYTGLIPTRDADILGIAVAYASFSDDTRVTADMDKAETTLELTYRFDITHSVTLQPDIQFINNPNGDPSQSNAVVSLLRMELSF